jgi:trehalose utilization protein
VATHRPRDLAGRREAALPPLREHGGAVDDDVELPSRALAHGGVDALRLQLGRDTRGLTVVPRSDGAVEDFDPHDASLDDPPGGAPRRTVACVRVRIWNEYVHERRNPAVAAVYPEGIHEALAAGLAGLLPQAAIATATLGSPGLGLTEEDLRCTDVLVWWGHTAHDAVPDETAERVRAHVLAGMGLVALHSAHYAKPFRLLMGTSCNLRWREADDRELVWTVAARHPIAAGVPSPVVIERQEMYGELFDVPQPDELVFVSSFSGGEVFRSGLCYRRGGGRVFYFSPGHETYPVYRQPEIVRIVANGVVWAAAGGERTGAVEACIESPAGWFEHPTGS